MLDKIKGHKIQLLLALGVLCSMMLNVYLIMMHNASTNDNIAVEYSERITHPAIESVLLKSDNVEINSAQANIIPPVKLDDPHLFSMNIANVSSLKQVLMSADIMQNDIEQVVNVLQPVLTAVEKKASGRIQVEASPNDGQTQALKLKKLLVYLSKSRIEVNFNDKQNIFQAKRHELPGESKVKLSHGTINGSFFSSAKRAGIDSAIVMQLINLFSPSVDFQREIQSGDKFKVLYEYPDKSPNKAGKSPKIIYAMLNLNGEQRSLYRYEFSNGTAEYFDLQGNSIKRALLKTPINGAKLTSGYGFRHHPIHGYSKMHQGLDYGAPQGTPVLAAGDGVVEFVKKQSRGYGNHVQIKHNGIYSTLYAHMSKFSVKAKKGARIKQSDVIGYVGATGTATGPHLHYEVIERGKKVNPVKVKVQRVFPLKGSELAKFKSNIVKVKQMMADLDSNKTSNLADLKTNN